MNEKRKLLILWDLMLFWMHHVFPQSSLPNLPDQLLVVNWGNIVMNIEPWSPKLPRLDGVKLDKSIRIHIYLMFIQENGS